MDFSLSDEQRDLRDLVARILSDRVTAERLAALDSGGQWLDREVWQELARSGVLGVPLPEEAGGGGAGFLETHLILQAAGAAVGHLPLWPVLVLGALPVAEFGSPEQRDRLLKPVIAGEGMLTAALSGDGALEATAYRAGSGWRVDGLLGAVPIGQLADRVLVPAAVGHPEGEGRGGDVVVLIVDPRGPGVTVRAQQTVNGEPQAELELAGAEVAEADVLAGPETGRQALGWMLEHAWAGLASLQAGLCDRVVRMSAEYTSGREQFGRPIASFQAVGQRMADAYIDAEAMRLTSLQAAWRLAEGLPATDEVAIAKWWAAEGGHRVLHAAQHVHGGVGVDLDYPLHRFFLAGKQVEFALGPATRHLLRLGSRLAEEPVSVPAGGERSEPEWGAGESR
jgi:alkylation response protein AidB-like acyl-CoA dehydrogenase